MSVTFTCVDGGTLSLQRTTMLTLLLWFYTNKHIWLIFCKNLQTVVGAGRRTLPAATGETGLQERQHLFLHCGEWSSWSRPPAERTEGCDCISLISSVVFGRRKLIEGRTINSSKNNSSRISSYLTNQSAHKERPIIT